MDARELLRKRIALSARRGATSTVPAEVAPDVPWSPEDDDEDGAAASSRPAPRPGVLSSASSGQGTLAQDTHVQPPTQEKAPPKEQASSTAVDLLRNRVRRAEEEERVQSNFKRSMAALRSLGRLMEAVYVRPGSRAPVEQRVDALRRLAQASSDLGEEFLRVWNQQERSPYARAMAMQAVVDLVAAHWERSTASADGSIDADVLDLLEEAGADDRIVQAAEQLAEQTWVAVQTKDQYREALALAAHRAYWRLYMLGEDVNGMSASRCVAIAGALMRYLQEFEGARGETAQMRASWVSASMGRLVALFCAEAKARSAQFKSDQDISDKDIEECIHVACSGFEAIEAHAEKLLDLSNTPSAPVEHPVDR